MRAGLTARLGVFLLASLAWGCGHPAGSMPASPTFDPQAQELEAPNGRFTLATYNVENLFDGSTVKIDKQHPLKSEAAKKALGASLHALNADVVALEEVESEPTLKHFRDQYLADMGYRHLVLVEGNDPRSIDVAILSRFKIDGVKSHKADSFPLPDGSRRVKFSRDLLQATVHPGRNYAFTLFVTHFKSHLGGASADAKRLAEAQEAQAILKQFEQQHPSSNFAIAGDMNDTAAAPPLAPLFTPGQAQPKLLDTLAELGPNAFSYFPIQYRALIDHILLSRSMAAEYVQGSARILDSADAEAASDHLPAMVTIDGSRNRPW